MRILSRYILKEHWGPFMVALLTIVFVFLVNTIFRDLGRLLNKGVSIGVIFQFFALNLAWIVALAVPMAVLVASLMAFGRLSADHELTALKASGVHFYRLVTPVVVAALVLVVGMERFNNVVLPEVNHQYKRLYSDISKKRPTVTLEPQVFNEIENHSLLAEKIDEDRNLLTGVVINDYSDLDKSVTILADSGKVTFSERDERLVLQLFSGEMHEADLKDLSGYRRGAFDRLTYYITVSNVALKRRDRAHRGNREKNVTMLRQDLAENREAMAEQVDRIGRTARADWEGLIPPAAWTAPKDSALVIKSRQTAQGRVDRMKRQVESSLSVIKGQNKSASIYRVEIHKKYAIPMACLVFVLIGAPLGFMARQGGLAVGGGLSMIFFLIYWVFLIGGESLADRGLLDPVVAMWLPNTLVGAGGILLMVRSVKESSFIPWDRLAALIKSRRRG